jgi:hypothetical protein
MPLTRACDRFVMRERDLHFLMKDDDGSELICSISSNTLLALGLAVGLSHPGFIFLAFRDRIERAAIDKYERSVRVAYEILEVKEHDLPPGVGQSVLSHPAMR